MREHLVFGDQRRSRILRDHKPAVEAAVGSQERGQVVVERGVDEALRPPLGNVGIFRERDGEKIERERHWLAVEVAAGDDVAFLWEDQRIVGDGVDLAAHRVIDVFNRVPARAVNLRDTADGVRVLYLAGDILAGKLAVLEDVSQVFRAGDLPRVTAQLMHARIKRLCDTALRLAGE